MAGIQTLFLLLPSFFLFALSQASFMVDNSTELANPDSRGRVCAQTEPTLCPVTCFRPDPVCGSNGVTYWCGCADALCSEAVVLRSGFCEVGNGGSGLVYGQGLLLVHMVWHIVLGLFVIMGIL
ncbi:hypothetical protein AMTRI_Chr09g19160 [Amborella trichopoda]